ncbi:uncharacterized protein LOC113338623 [Papaver somniferum]|uniref:uncharacterized protein LOC113338623 n=1 Tax=Papaver somniferum TaxID=3469 RepID=UPI000E6FA6C1|nr:uncharacterized protein LOC113338623 [Papaver somniferum]
MIAEILLMMIKRAAGNNLIIGFKVSPTGTVINHLQFADDLIVFLDDSEEQYCIANGSGDTLRKIRLMEENHLGEIWRKKDATVSAIVSLEGAWSFDFKRNPNEIELGETVLLLQQRGNISTRIALSDLEDTRKWELATKSSITNVYSSLDVDGFLSFPHKQLWNSKVPLVLMGTDGKDSSTDVTPVLGNVSAAATSATEVPSPTPTMDAASRNGCVTEAAAHSTAVTPVPGNVSAAATSATEVPSPTPTMDAASRDECVTEAAAHSTAVTPVPGNVSAAATSATEVPSPAPTMVPKDTSPTASPTQLPPGSMERRFFDASLEQIFRAMLKHIENITDINISEKVTPYFVSPGDISSEDHQED